MHGVLVQVDLPSWVNFPDYERVNWVNSIVGKFEPCLASSSAHAASVCNAPTKHFLAKHCLRFASYQYFMVVLAYKNA